MQWASEIQEKSVFSFIRKVSILAYEFISRFEFQFGILLGNWIFDDTLWWEYWMPMINQGLVNLFYFLKSFLFYLFI